MFITISWFKTIYRCRDKYALTWMKYYTESPTFKLYRATNTCIHLHKGEEKLHIMLGLPVIHRPQTALLLIHIDHYVGWLIVSLSLYIYVPAECGKLRPICRLICSGMSLLISSGDAPANCSRSFHCRMIKILFGCWILFTIQIYEKLLIGCPCVWFGSCRTDV